MHELGGLLAKAMSRLSLGCVHDQIGGLQVTMQEASRGQLLAVHAPNVE